MESALALQIIDRLTKQVEELVGAKMESEKLREERDRLKEVCSRLFSENESLKVCNDDLTKERDRLVEELKEQIKYLEREVRKRDEFIDNNTPSNVNELTEERDRLLKENNYLTQEIGCLKKALHSSSLPKQSVYASRWEVVDGLPQEKAND